jgi:hypothetical protein
VKHDENDANEKAGKNERFLGIFRYFLQMASLQPFTRRIRLIKGLYDMPEPLDDMPESLYEVIKRPCQVTTPRHGLTRLHDEIIKRRREVTEARCEVIARRYDVMEPLRDVTQPRPDRLRRHYDVPPTPDDVVLGRREVPPESWDVHNK